MRYGSSDMSSELGHLIHDDLTGVDAPVRSLFERIAGPAASEDAPDLAEIGAALVAFARDLDYVMRWVDRLGDTSGALAIHAPARGPRLSIVHRPEGEIGAVHDHGTWIALTPIVGVEAHRRYQVTGAGAAARLHLVETERLAPTELATLLPPDDLHDHGHLLGDGQPAYVLIMAGDDQFLATRNEWDPATGRHRILRPGDRGRWLASEPWPAG